MRWEYVPTRLLFGILVLGGVLLLYGMFAPETPGEALAAALEQGRPESAHFVMTITISPPGETMRVEGDILFPDRMRGVMEAPGQRSEVVLIGQVMYTRPLPNGTWQKQVTVGSPPWLSQLDRNMAVPGNAPFEWSQDVGRQWVAAGLSVESLAAAPLNGIMCDRYRIRADMARLAALMAKQLGEEDPLVQALKAVGSRSTFEMVYWVGQADRRVYGVDVDVTWTSEALATLLSTFPPAKHPPEGVPLAPTRVQMRIRYSDFGKPVVIQPPIP